MTSGTGAEVQSGATRFAYLAIHGGKYASARVALVDPTEDDDEEDDLGSEHRRTVREPAGYFRDDAGADLPVPHRARLRRASCKRGHTINCNVNINGAHFDCHLAKNRLVSK